MQNDPLEDDPLINQFTQWQEYQKLQNSETSLDVQPYSESKKGRRHGAVRQSSTKRTDFTHKSELSNSMKRGRFIFHRGFFQRNNSLRRRGSHANQNRSWWQSKRRRRPVVEPSPPRFRNRQELISVMDFIDLPEMEVSQVLPSQLSSVFAVHGAFSSQPIVAHRRFLPTKYHNGRSPRHGSIKRHLPQQGKPLQGQVSVDTPRPSGPPRTALPQTPNKSNKAQPPPSAYNAGVGRALTSPATMFRYKDANDEDPESVKLRSLWREYIGLTIQQRVALRVQLLLAAPQSAAKPDSIHGLDLESSPVSPLNIRDISRPGSPDHHIITISTPSPQSASELTQSASNVLQPLIDRFDFELPHRHVSEIHTISSY